MTIHKDIPTNSTLNSKRYPNGLVITQTKGQLIAEWHKTSPNEEAQ